MGTAEWHRVLQEQERASNSSGFADRHERYVAVGSGRPDAAFHRRIAAVHRQAERRHLAVADLYCSKALRYTLNAEESVGARRFCVMADVAALAGARAAVLTMVDTHTFETLIAASETPARRAQDMEFVLGEGPVRDVLADRGQVRVDGPGFDARWPAYGPELRILGYHSVAAFPLYLESAIVGAIVLLDPDPARDAGRRLTVEYLGSALVRALSTGGSTVLGGGTDQRTDVVRAAEVIALHYGGTLDDAIAIIRTRAFAEQERVDKVVRAILQECASASR